MNIKNQLKRSPFFTSFLLFILFGFTCFISSNTAYSQIPGSDTMIEWSATPLKPMDFTIIPDTTNTGSIDAYTTTKYFPLKRKVRRQGVEYLDVKVVNNFLKTKSWMKKGYINDTLLLRHEQGHFDISEIYARRIIKALDSVAILPSDYMNDFIRRGDEPYRSMQQQAHLDYDRETNHGVNRFVQKIWNRKIQEELEELEKYSSKQVLVRLKMK